MLTGNNWFSGPLPQDSSPKYNNKNLHHEIIVIDTPLSGSSFHQTVSSLRTKTVCVFNRNSILLRYNLAPLKCTNLRCILTRAYPVLPSPRARYRTFHHPDICLLPLCSQSYPRGNHCSHFYWPLVLPVLEFHRYRIIERLHPRAWHAVWHMAGV